VPPEKVKPLMIAPADPVWSSSVLTAGFAGVMIDSVADRPHALTPLGAPLSVTPLVEHDVFGIGPRRHVDSVAGAGGVNGGLNGSEATATRGFRKVSSQKMIS